MLQRRTRISPQSAHGQLAAALAALRDEFDVPEGFPEDALEEARTTVPPLPDRDLRDIPFVTLDPVGSRDLDQAFQIERRGAGYRLRYAIADLPSFVPPAGALDRESRARGQTFYLPDGAVPLHPRTLSEGKASLLPGEDRPAHVWSFDLDSDGTMTSARVERSMVRSRAQLDYPSAQRRIDEGAAEGSLALLPELGRLRIEQERARGGASLNLPDEEILREPDGYRIARRFPLPTEEWNAQLSLLTGMAAAELMLQHGIGILRTMPRPSDTELESFRARVALLGAPWAEGTEYGEYLRHLDHSDHRTPAVLQAAASLFRGAGYEAFDGEAPEHSEQAAIGAPYAHVTAPLRRLVDRWGLVLCEALCAGEEPPGWLRETLPELPGWMRVSNQRVSQLNAAVLDRVEAALLRDRTGEEFTAVVVEARETRARVQITDPAVTCTCQAEGLVAGTLIRVRVLAADVPTGTIELRVVSL